MTVEGKPHEDVKTTVTELTAGVATKHTEEDTEGALEPGKGGDPRFPPAHDKWTSTTQKADGKENHASTIAAVVAELAMHPTDAEDGDKQEAVEIESLMKETVKQDSPGDSDQGAVPAPSDKDLPGFGSSSSTAAVKEAGLTVDGGSERDREGERATG